MDEQSKQPVEGLLCAYSHRVCMSPVLEGSEFCGRHAVDDQRSIFKQCSYVSVEDNKRCSNASHRFDRKDGLCKFHSKRSLAKRQHSSRKPFPPESADTLLERLEYMFHNRDANQSSSPSQALTTRLLDYRSSSESDSDNFGAKDAFCLQDNVSDVDSLDSDYEDPLKHASVYTAEEVAVITKDKLIKLQSLYIDQFKRLQYNMREHRRAYLQAATHEQHALGTSCISNNDMCKNGFDKLIAMRRYHRKYGKEALLDKQSKERRLAKSQGATHKSLAYPKCIFTPRGSSRCAKRTMPLSKYCQSHILYDPHQVLYRPCGHKPPLVKDAQPDTCIIPVVNFNAADQCHYHTRLHEHTERISKEEEDMNMPVDVVGADGGDE